MEAFETRSSKVYDLRVDQCALGLRCPKTKMPVLKPTRLATSSNALAQALRHFRCDHKHEHAHLVGKFRGRNLTSYAESYPAKFCRAVSNALITCSEEIHAGELDTISVHSEDTEEADQDIEGDASADRGQPRPRQIAISSQTKAMIRKLHVNTGHASNEQMMRLAVRCQSSQEIKEAIKQFKCPICSELKSPPSYRKTRIPGPDHPNEVVGIDFVQVELKSMQANGRIEEVKYRVLTCVDMATDFAQQYVMKPGDRLSQAFHEVWSRPYGCPKTIYMDPTNQNLSKEFQAYLVERDIQLLLAAAESHWQLGRVEIANGILRGMAQRCWQATSRPAEEVIETCASIRNEHLRKNGFSPSQWFLGVNPRHAGMLDQVEDQENLAIQSQVLAMPSFAEKLHLRETAARAFREERAKDAWRRAIAHRNRPMRSICCRPIGVHVSSAWPRSTVNKAWYVVGSL